MSLPTLRVGIVGHGFMGKMHTHAYRSLNFYYEELPAHIELVGIATHTEASYKAAQSRWGFTFGTTDYQELCARDDIDIINCCAPNNLHKDVLLCALKNGKHVYMDKPLACNYEDACEMRNAAAARPECVTQMTFQYRFVPALLKAKQLVDEGKLGRLFQVRTAYLHAGYIDLRRPWSWRLDPKISGPGGALFDLGSHVIDITRHLAGEIDSVLHLGKTFIDERPLKEDPTKTAKVEVDDVSLLMARFQNGALGTIESSRLATGVQDELRIELHGSVGAIRFNLMQPNYLEFYDATKPGGDYGGERGFKHIECVGRYPKPAQYPGPKNTIGWERFHIHCLHNFVTRVVEGKPAQPDVADGARTQAVLEAAIQSSNSNQWTNVPE